MLQFVNFGDELGVTYNVQGRSKVQLPNPHFSDGSFSAASEPIFASKIGLQI